MQGVQTGVKDEEQEAEHVCQENPPPCEFSTHSGMHHAMF